MRFLKSIVFILISLLLITCDSDRLDVNVSDIDVSISFDRFDKELEAANQSNMATEVERLHGKYGLFFEEYVNSVINTGGPNPEVVASNLIGFLEDANIRELHHRTFDEFTETKEIEEELKIAFKYYNYHFPKKVVPKIVTFISGFNYAIIAMDSTLGLGLDMYLGANCEYYPALGIPKYKSNIMTKDHLVVDALKGWSMSEFSNESKEKDLLSEMIYEGKIMYLMDAFYPAKSDTIKIGFSSEQLLWCDHYEFNLWSHLVQNKLLFSKNQSDIVQFTGEGPFTRGFDKVSPARTGVWLGWQIIRSYMNKHPEVSLAKLMEGNDAQAILRDSGYNPKL
jgi:gliding motility-associated lipoprotein GldB